MERNHQAQAIITENIKMTKAEKQFHLMKMDANKAIGVVKGPFDLVFLDEGIDMIQESQHTFIEYKTIKEVIDTGTLIMMLTRAGAVLYFEKKNATKTQYEGIREIFEKKNILCKMKNI